MSERESHGFPGRFLKRLGATPRHARHAIRFRAQYLKFDARSVWISRKWQEMEWNEQPQVIHQIYDHCQLSSHSDYPRGG